MTEALQIDWLDAIPAAILLVQDNRVVVANRAAAALIGCLPPELVGVAVANLIDGDLLKPRAGSPIPIDVTSAEVEHDGSPARLITVSQRQPPNLYRAAFENGVDSFYLAQLQRDAQGKYIDIVVVDANERGLELSQMPREQLIGFSITKLYPDIPRPELLDGFVAVLNTRQPYNRELLLTDMIVKDGWYHVQLIPLADDHIAVFLRDISAREESEADVQRLGIEVEKQVHLLDEILSVTPDGFILFDRAGHYLYVNRSGLESAGLTAEQVTGKTWRELGFPEEAGLTFEKRLEYVFTTGQPITYEEPFPTMTGLRDFITTLTPIHDKDGGVILMLNTIHDITERKQSERDQSKLAAELEQQTRVFDEVLSTTPDAFLMFDQQGKFVYASPSALRNVGMTTQQLIGKTWAELGFPEETGRRSDEIIAQILEDGQPVSVEISFPTVEGLRDFESIFSPLHDKDGKTVAVVTTNRDITERKHIEEALRENQRLLTSIYETALAGIAVVDAVGSYVQVNRTYSDIYGYTPAEMIGRHFTMILPPELQERGQISHDRVISGKSAGYVGDWRVQRKNGQPSEVKSYNNLFVRDDGERFRVVVILDVSQQNQAQRALEESEQRLTSILDSMQDAVWSVQSDKHKLLYANPAIEAMTGYSSADFAATDNLIVEMVHPDDRQRFADELDRARDSERIDTEYRIIRRDGETCLIHNRFWIVSGERIDGIMTDITGRKEAADQAMQLAIERERVHILSDFVRDASHEFRTPLSVINTRLYLLEKVTDPARQADYIEGIREQSERILKLVESLITMSRLDTLTRMHFERLDLNRVLTVLNVSASAAATRKSMNFMLETSPENLYIQGDMHELMLAFNAILDNAFNYTARGGQVDVRGYRLNQQEVVVEVQDSGIGIAAHELSHIFERFYRIDTARSIRGFGLGLPIARKIVEMHRGRIEVESVPGKGSLFRLVFPIDRRPERTPELGGF